jgi:hypothetical protein
LILQRFFHSLVRHSEAILGSAPKTFRQREYFFFSRHGFYSYITLLTNFDSDDDDDESLLFRLVWTFGVARGVCIFFHQKKEVSARATWEGALLEKFLFFFSRVRQFFCAGEREEFFFPPPPPKFFFEEEQLTHHFRPSTTTKTPVILSNFTRVFINNNGYQSRLAPQETRHGR